MVPQLGREGKWVCRKRDKTLPQGGDPCMGRC
jgi:hypothetical protein